MANEFDYMDRILTNEQVSGDQNVLRLDPEASVRATDQRYLSDAYNYFLGGGKGIDPGAAVQVPGTTANVSGTADQGTGGGGIGTILSPGPALPDLGGAQNPLTQMVTDPATGQTQTVKQAMTSNQAYAIPGQMPKTPVSGVWGPQDYLQPTTPITQDPMTGDASIAEAIAAQDRQDVFDEQFAYEDAKARSPEQNYQAYLDLVEHRGLEGPYDAETTTYTSPLDSTTGLPIGATTAVGAAMLPAASKAASAADDWIWRGDKLGKQFYKNVPYSKALEMEKGWGFDPKYKGPGAVKMAQNPNLLQKGVGFAKYLGNAFNPNAANISGGTPLMRMATQQPGAFAKGVAGSAGKFVKGATMGPFGLATGYVTAADALQDSLERKGLTGEGGIADLAVYADPMSAGADVDPSLAGVLSRGQSVEGPMDYLQPDYGEPTLEDMARDSQYGSYMPDQAVTGITGPAGMDLADTGQEVYQDPIMDMVAADQGVTADAGFSDADIQTAQSPESKSLLEKVARGAATAGDYVSQYGMAAWNFAQGNMMGGALGLMGGPLGLAPMLGGLQKTDVTPEDKAANVEFEQRNKINIGDDGRITSGPLQGLNPAGKSFAGSANYEEMVDKKIADIKNRKAPQTDASRLKIAELEAMKGPETRDARIDAGILAAEDDKGRDMLDIPTEEEEDITDLKTFEQLGGWLGRDDVSPETGAPTGIKGPPSIISPEPAEPTGPPMADVAGPAEPTTPTPTVTTSVPRGGGADRDPAPSKPDTSGWDSGGYDPAPAPSKSVGRQDPEGGGGDGCFVKGTPITMADGSTKPVEQVDLGDEGAEGGKVFAAGRFLTEELHDN